jgi:hypothetical protein
MNKGTIVSLLPSPIFFLFLLEAKMGDNSKLVAITFFFLYCYCYEQGNSSKLIAITHFFLFFT